MRFTVSALVVAGAAAFAPTQPAARPSTSLGMADAILKKHTGQASLDPSVVAQYASLPLPTDKGELRSCVVNVLIYYLFIGSIWPWGIKQKYAMPIIICWRDVYMYALFNLLCHAV